MVDDIPQWDCTKCGAAFHPSAWMVANSFRQCHDCKRAYEREYRAKRKAAGDPIPSKIEDPGKRRERYARQAADPNFRQAINAASRARYTDPQRQLKVKARSAAGRAIEAGKLLRQPCEVCQAPQAEAHHDDYSKPLDVRWLCRAHHREHHRSAA